MADKYEVQSVPISTIGDCVRFNNSIQTKTDEQQEEKNDVKKSSYTSGITKKLVEKYRSKLIFKDNHYYMMIEGQMVRSKTLKGLYSYEKIIDIYYLLKTVEEELNKEDGKKIVIYNSVVDYLMKMKEIDMIDHFSNTIITADPDDCMFMLCMKEGKQVVFSRLPENKIWGIAKITINELRQQLADSGITNIQKIDNYIPYGVGAFKHHFDDGKKLIVGGSPSVYIIDGKNYDVKFSHDSLSKGKFYKSEMSKEDLYSFYLSKIETCKWLKQCEIPLPELDEHDARDKVIELDDYEHVVNTVGYGEIDSFMETYLPLSKSDWMEERKEKLKKFIKLCVDENREVPIEIISEYNEFILGESCER